MRRSDLIPATFILAVFSYFLVFTACKKDEEPKPVPAGPATIIHSEITLGNLLAADNNILTGNDSLLVYYYQQDTIFKFVPTDFYSPYTFPELEDKIKLGVVDIPEFTFGFDFSLNNMLPFFGQEASDSLVNYDSTIQIFPTLLLNEQMISDNGSSDDYYAIAIKSGQIEIKLQNTLPVAIENLQISIIDIPYNIVLKDIILPRMDSGSVYTTNVSLIAKKFSNHFAVILKNFSSPGSDTNAVMIHLSEGLKVDLKLKSVMAYGGITKVNAQLVGSIEKWIDINTSQNEKYFTSLFEKGTISLSVTGMNHVNLVVYYTLPTVLRNQVVVNDYVFAPHQQAVKKDTSIQGMLFDFSTHSIKPYNRFPVKIDVYLQASDSMLSIDSSDIAEIQLDFSDEVPFYNYGFYGRKTIHSAPAVFEVNTIIAGQKFENILFEEPSLIFSYYNNLNLPIKLFPALSAVNLQTSESIALNTDSVKVLYPLIPGESAITEVAFESGSSNVKDLFDIKPDHFFVQVDGRTNWNGQAENFSWDTCAFYGNLSLKIPLILRSNFLVFSDTIQVKSTVQNGNDGQGKLLLKVTNGFPFAMNLKLKLLKPGENEMSETIDFGNIASADVDANGKVSKPVETNVELEIDSSLTEILQKTKTGVIEMETDKIGYDTNPVSLYSNYKISIIIAYDKEGN